MKAMPESKNAVADKNPDAAGRQMLLDTIRAVVARRPAGNYLTLIKFLAESKLSERQVFRHFPKWSEAVQAAGCKFKRYNAPIPTAELLEDWAALTRELGRMPTHKEYKIRGKRDTTTFRNRFGAWSKVPHAFREFAGSDEKWSDVVALLPPADAYSRTSRYRVNRKVVTSRPRQRRAARLPGRPICGLPLGFAGLSHAPVNEAGVLFLFGAMGRDLGFTVESLQNEFPDCTAKRIVAPNVLQTFRIEFEFQSRNFREHGHDPEACDIIVCWEHNWPECPVEVMALSEELKRLKRTHLGD